MAITIPQSIKPIVDFTVQIALGAIGFLVRKWRYLLWTFSAFVCLS